MQMAVLALVALLATVSASQSPEELGLRPGPPLEHLPPPTLIEVPNRRLDPGPRDLNTTVLKAKLGSYFDPEFMSVTKPRQKNPQMNFFRRNRRGRLVPVGEMPRTLKNFNFKYFKLSDGTKVRTRISTKLKRKLQQFLWAFTSCPVLYKWKDLGIRFWPRYFKEGHCTNGKTSCSIPPGMTCKPAKTTHKIMLRWHCYQNHNGQHQLRYNSGMPSTTLSSGFGLHSPTSGDDVRLASRSRCVWINVSYPIVAECSCSCPTDSNT